MRELVKSPAVRWRTEGTVGYVKISGFTQQTQPGLEKAMAGIDAELGPGLTGYVLDLRDNPGGLVKQAISVGDQLPRSGRDRVDPWPRSLLARGTISPRRVIWPMASRS